MQMVMRCLVCVLLSSATHGVRSDDLVTGISPKQSVEVGSSVELECSLVNIPDRAEVAWVRMKGVGDVEYLSIYNREEGIIDYDEELFSSEMSEGSWTWRLIISHVSKTMGGLYQCQVLQDDEVISSLHVLLTVLDPAIVAHNTKYLISKHGGNITLDCTDLDGGDVNWNRMGDNYVVQNGRHLSLIRVDRSDSGIYVCSVSGSSETLNFSLLVEHIPTVIPLHNLTYQAPGYPSSLSCEVTAAPVPAVSWYRVGSHMGQTIIRSHQDISIIIQDYKEGRMISSLVFDNVTQEDFGEYSCNATNSLGQASSLVQLVFSPTPIIPQFSAASTLSKSGLVLFMACLGIAVIVAD